MIPSYTIAGQIASFIDKGEGRLGLSYNEAVNEIPYELILLMQKDKAHWAGDDAKVEVEDEDDYISRMDINLIKE